MFESAEIGHRIRKSVYQREEPALRQALLQAQYELLENATFPVVVLVNGVDGAGKGETVNLLNEWMDPRHIRTRAFGAMTEGERDRPEMWRFWQALPPKGHIGILFGSWYTDPIIGRVMGRQKRAQFRRRLESIRHFERMLVAEGALVVKLWFHLSRRTQKKRLRELASDRRTAWRVSREEWKRFAHYDEFVGVCEEALRETSTGEAPWQIIDGSDPEYRALTAGRLLLEALQQRLSGAHCPVIPPPPLPHEPLDGRNLLNTRDYTLSIPREDYRRRLERQQTRLGMLTRHKRMRERGVVIVFEGMDAAGKGSAIRRATAAMDARYYRVVPIAAPTDEERAQPYLWRFWRHVPRIGRVSIFDRTWYGRVLVERVEGFCTEADWLRAYAEINDFEHALVQSGAIVVKFWLQVSNEEQLKRFKEREKTEFKRFKITEEDWRNRKKWDAYAQAVCDMVERTSTGRSPWTLVEANDKNHARVKVLRTICEKIERVLEAK